MATRMSLLRCLTAALVAGFALSLAPTAPVHADEDPGYRSKRVRAPAPRYRATPHPAPQVRTVVQVRTVERVRTRVVCYDYTGQPFDCRGPAPVAPQPAPVVQVAPQPVYYTCGGCAAPQPVVYAPAVTATCGTCAPPVQQYYYGTGCGGCVQPGGYYGGGYHGGYGGYGGYYSGAPYYRGYHRAAPYRWAVRTAHYYRRGGWR